jgi:guanylate kinase
MTQAAGTLFTVSAPSGAGKTSLVKALVERSRPAGVRVAHDPADPPGEEDGVNYHFCEPGRTSRPCSAKAPSWSTPRSSATTTGPRSAWVDARLADGRDVILEIDWQGAEQVQAFAPGDLSPSSSCHRREAALRERLRGAARTTKDTIARRMAEAVGEMSHHVEFDYLVVNDDFDIALATCVAIVPRRTLCA